MTGRPVAALRTHPVAVHLCAIYFHEHRGVRVGSSGYMRSWFDEDHDNLACSEHERVYMNTCIVLKAILALDNLRLAPVF